MNQEAQNALFIELRERGLVHSLTSEKIASSLCHPLSFYIGFDPTASALHLGNLVPIVMVRWLQKMGHQPVILMGGASGRIGDPSGRDQERPCLSKEEIQSNATQIEQLLKAILCRGEEFPPPLFLDNIDWFANQNCLTFLREIGKHFRINSMLSKESVQNRLQQDHGMSFTEFSYSLLQAYDFLHLFCEREVILQIGGSDQWGNITAGIELVRKKCQREVFGWTFPLLTQRDGKKFGKSEGGAIWLSSQLLSPYHFYQYFFSLPDEDIPKLLRWLTFLPLSLLEKKEREFRQGSLPANALKSLLAAEVTEFVHGIEARCLAEKSTEILLPGKQVSPQTLSKEVWEEIKRSEQISHLSWKRASPSSTLLEFLASFNLFPSRGQIRRLVQNGGISLNGQVMTDPAQLLPTPLFLHGRYCLLAVGKKKKYLIEPFDE